MMKKIIGAGICGLMAFCAQAQSFQKNDVILSGGLGQSLFSLADWDTYKNIPGFSSKFLQPITFKGEFAISDEIGIGLSTVYSAASARWTDSSFSYESNYSKLSITPRMNLHFLRKKVVDMYLGGGIGYKTGEYTYKTNNPRFKPVSSLGVIPVSLEASLGIRAYITPEFGGFAEFGIGHGFLQFGLAYKPMVHSRN